MSDVFISYAREDRSRVELIAKMLIHRGWNVWWDPKIRPGQSWDRVIEQALDETRCVVVVWSKRSVSRDWVRQEAREGKKRSVLVPVLIDPVEEVQIPLEFRHLEYADLSDWRGPEDHGEFQSLLEAISMHIGPLTSFEVFSASSRTDVLNAKHSSAKQSHAIPFFDMQLADPAGGIGDCVPLTTERDHSANGPGEGIVEDDMRLEVIATKESNLQDVEAGTNTRPAVDASLSAMGIKDKMSEAGLRAVSGRGSSGRQAKLSDAKAGQQNSDLNQDGATNTGKYIARHLASMSSPEKIQSRLFVLLLVGMLTIAIGIYLRWQYFKAASEPQRPSMVVIPAGEFSMGSPDEEGDKDERPVHEVSINKPFAMARYETTFEEYDLFAKATGRQLPYDPNFDRGRRAVINVSWEDATDYAAWLSEQTGKRYRLPTEAEWEYAARSGGLGGIQTGTSDEKNLNTATSLVGSKEPNGFGLYDLIGNVWEWVADCRHDNYQGAPKDGTAWGEADSGNCRDRVIRGGSWFSEPGNLRASNRNWNRADTREENLGFRLVQDLD